MSKHQKRPNEETRERIFELHVQGMSAGAIARELQIAAGRVEVEVKQPEFRERVRAYRDERLDSIARRLEAGGEIAAMQLARVAGAQVDKSLAGTVISASDSILDRIGFPRTTKTRIEQTGRMVNVEEDRFAGWTEEELRHYAKTGEEPKGR